MEDLIPIFYYLRDYNKRPVITVCLLYKKRIGGIARGIALCSPKDNPTKQTGRSIAHGRALRAVKRKMNGLPINRMEAISILEDVDTGIIAKMFFDGTMPLGVYKSEFRPSFIPFEGNLIQKLHQE